MKKMIMTVFLAGALLFTGTAFTGTLVVVPTDSKLISKTWNYREVSTRSVWWGYPCWQYDVLQGSGWFRGTWYEDIEPVYADGEYTYAAELRGWACHCNAEMDQYNNVQLEYTDVAGVAHRGAFSVIPDGNAAEAVIRCSLTGQNDEWYTMDCEDAHVDWSEKGKVRVNVIFE